MRSPVTGAELLHADIHDPTAMRSALAGQDFDAVVDWIAFTQKIFKGISNFSKGKRVNLCSSVQPLPTRPLSPTCRSANPPCLKTPSGHTRVTKSPAKNCWFRHTAKNKFPFTIVRPSHTYDQTSVPVEGGYTVIDRMLKGKPVIVHGDGTSIWTLTHNTDFAKGLLVCSEIPVPAGETFHITSDEWLTWNQIYQTLGEAAGVSPELVHIPSDLIAAYDATTGDSLLGDKSHCAIFDNTKIKQMVPEFSATTPFARGAEQIIAWHQADPARQKTNPGFNNLCERLLTNYQKAWPTKN